ncbi:o-succinylbenzoate--CoA ligase [Haloferax larsenii]|uniref:2-succinylbenzoate--CoA ligase n=1 Tax=Haloferax larsenii TaxID=302484 RepID=A0ABY5RDP4_HALLR|nr:o-succinylbenzoate--CoA ligase [Haloferax larsenii]UVE49568.1 o-succinylbenzoate--CoA ligase [Haloferax larsenii]
MTNDSTTDDRDDSTTAGLSRPMRDWLSHRVAATPDRQALILASSGESLTFRELDTLVTETAGQLAALGIEAGDHLGVILEPGLQYVRLIHAATRLGAVLVPLSERLTATEVERNVDIADVTTLICGEESEAVAVEATSDVPVASVDEPRWEGVVNLSSIAPKSITPAGWGLSETMLLLFTSGTTGTPKAVRLSMGNLLANAVASAFRLGLSPDDRWMVTLSLHHMGGIGPILRSPLYGTTVVLREEFAAGGAADDIGKYDVTGVSLVPTMLTRMLDSRGTLSDSLRVVLLGGAPATDDLIERCRNYSVPVYPTYGMTETASQIATATPREAFDAIGTVGRPLYFADLTVVDDDGAPVEPGTVGEIVVSGPTVTTGYYQNPEANAESFTDRGLRTGDIGYRDEDGLLYVLNRRDDRIVTGGENVDPGEVVEVLRQYPAIDDAVVLGISDPEWGERVSALVVPTDPETSIDETALEAFCREHLAGYKIPRLVETETELPRTVSGTIDRDAVRERLEAARPVDVAEPGWQDDDSAASESDDGSLEADSDLVDDAEATDADADDSETGEVEAGEGETDAAETDEAEAESSDAADPEGVAESGATETDDEPEATSTQREAPDEPTASDPAADETTLNQKTPDETTPDETAPESEPRDAGRSAADVADEQEADVVNGDAVAEAEDNETGSADETDDGDDAELEDDADEA